MSLALGARILEAATIFVGVLFLFTVVSLHRSELKH
jgi:hypothetical protein